MKVYFELTGRQIDIIPQYWEAFESFRGVNRLGVQKAGHLRRTEHIAL